MLTVTPSHSEGIGHVGSYVCMTSYGIKVKLENFKEPIIDLNSSISNNLQSSFRSILYFYKKK
jgi:hypothetical protein